MDCQCLAGRQPNLPALHISGLLSRPALPTRVVSCPHYGIHLLLQSSDDQSSPVLSCPVRLLCIFKCSNWSMCVHACMPLPVLLSLEICLRILRRLGVGFGRLATFFGFETFVSVLFHRPSEATEARAPASLLFCLCPYISVCITFTRDLHCQAGSCNHVWGSFFFFDKTKR
jgi:hypothetical protein